MAERSEALRPKSNYSGSSHLGTPKVSPKLAHLRRLTNAISDRFISQIGTPSARPAKALSLKSENGARDLQRKYPLNWYTSRDWRCTKMGGTTVLDIFRRSIALRF